MATQILPIASGLATSGDITLAAETLVWVHGSRGLDCSIGVNVKGSDGVYSELLMMGPGRWAGALPAGIYQFTRLGGKCGVQQA